MHKVFLSNALSICFLKDGFSLVNKLPHSYNWLRVSSSLFVSDHSDVDDKVMPSSEIGHPHLKTCDQLKLASNPSLT